MAVKNISTRMKICGRGAKCSGGHSAVEQSGYICREKMYSEYDGQTYYPKYAEDLVHSEVLLPENAPEEFKDPAKLWNSVEMNEKGDKAQLARTWRIELPNLWTYKPHTMVDDLAVTYHIAIGKEESSNMSAPITNRLMESYGASVEQLHQIALDNMDTLTPATFKSMTETMVDMMLPDMMRSGMSEEEAREAIAGMIPPTPEEMMYVLSNEDKLNGAAVLLNDKVMDHITEKLGQDYFILPSSVHEVLIVPKNDQMDLQTLENMVQDVNATQVSPEERLSDHVYAYDAKEHELFRADKAEERAAAKEAEASKEATVTKTEAKEEKKQERPSLKERLAQKKDIVAKNEANREPRQMHKDRGAQALT